MPNKPIEMYKIRQVLRLHAEGKGSKFISKTTGVARNTVKKYLLQYVMHRLTIEQVEKMSDGKLASLFLTEKPKIEPARVAELEDLLPELAAMLRKRGVN